MAHFYHVTAHKPTAVVSSCTGQFTGPDDLNLIIAKNTLLEIHEVTPEGLKFMKEITIFGKIAAIKLFKPKNKPTSSLFFVTHKAEAVIVECQKDLQGNLEFITVASGSFEEKSVQKIEQGFDILIDPENKILLIRYYMGLLKVINLAAIENTAAFGDNEDSLLSMHNIRMEENCVIDMAFLHGYTHPTFAVMHEDDIGLHIRSYEVEVSKLVPVAWNVQSIQSDSILLIPVPKPYGGAIVVGVQTICYHARDGHIVAQDIPQAKQCAMLCYCQVDELRYLLGDLAGRLYMVHLVRAGASSAMNDEPGSSQTGSNSSKITSVRVELLGETTIPQCIRYLDNGVIFVGSTLGNSQLVRLSPVSDDKWNFVTVLEQMTNIGPVVDMVMVDRDKQDQNQVITASGAYKEGSLRLIRNGIGIHEHASIDQEMIKAVWCFRCFGEEPFDDTIIISLVGQTQVLALSQDDIEPLALPGLDTELQTYHCAQVQPHRIIQVTLDSIRLIGTGASTPGLLDVWKPSSGKSVSLCNSWGNQIVAASGSQLSYLVVDSDKLKEVSSHTLEYEVACLDLTPIHAPGAPSERQEQSRMVAVGLWIDFSVVLLSLPELKPLLKEQLDSNVIPRSLLLAQFEDTPRLFVAMGDGTLIYYVIDVATGSLRECKRANVGTGPMYLRQWKSQSKTSVFVSSDHPCIVYSTNNNKLVFANVNLKEVTYMCPLNSEHYRDCLALVSPSCLMFGSVDEIQKLHVRTIPLEETPKRLAVQEATECLGLASHRRDVCQDGSFVPVRPSISVSTKVTKTQSSAPQIANSGASCDRERDEIDVYSFLVLSLSTLETLACHTFYASFTCSETIMSLISCQINGIPEPCFVVGTAFIVEEEHEPKSGRLSVFRLRDKQRLELVCEQVINGCPYSILEYNGRLVVAVNSSVRLLEYKDQSLRTVCGHYEHVLCLSLKRKGDFILVGDLMLSVTLLLYKYTINAFEVVGNHRCPRWTTAVDIVDNDLFMASETDYNIYMVSEDPDSNGDERRKLMECATFHTGEFINKFVHGSLVMQTTTEKSLGVSNPVLYGGIHGSLGLVCQISPSLYAFLHEVQRRLTRIVKPVGNLTHDSWRAFKADRISKMSENFIDGDLIETVLDLNEEDKAKLLADSPISLPKEVGDIHISGLSTDGDCSVEDLVKIVEELSRIH